MHGCWVLVFGLFKPQTFYSCHSHWWKTDFAGCKIFCFRWNPDWRPFWAIKSTAPRLRIYEDVAQDFVPSKGRIGPKELTFDRFGMFWRFHCFDLLFKRLYLPLGFILNSGSCPMGFCWVPLKTLNNICLDLKKTSLKPNLRNVSRPWNWCSMWSDLRTVIRDYYRTQIVAWGQTFRINDLEHWKHPTLPRHGQNVPKDVWGRFADPFGPNEVCEGWSLLQVWLISSFQAELAKGRREPVVYGLTAKSPSESSKRCTIVPAVWRMTAIIYNLEKMRKIVQVHIHIPPKVWHGLAFHFCSA